MYELTPAEINADVPRLGTWSKKDEITRHKAIPLDPPPHANLVFSGARQPYVKEVPIQNSYER